MKDLGSLDIARRQLLRLAGGGAVLAALPGGMARAAAERREFLRIATGPTPGTYFPVGSVLATAMSNPPGTRACSRGGICGVPNLIVVAHSSEGSVENVTDIASGTVESALCQADVAHWAYNGLGPFDGRPLESLRVIARLYSESLHVVVGADRGIWRIEDLAGKRMSIDRTGSGTHSDARLLLEAHGLGPDDLDLRELSLGAAADALIADELDGFFLVSGAPTPAVTQLSDRSLVTFLSIDEVKAEAMREKNPFLTPTTIQSGVYFNVPFTKTLAVEALWLVSADLPDDLIYDITSTLWDRHIQQLIALGHRQGDEMSLAKALESTGTPPLHKGALQYYQEQGFFLFDLDLG